MITAWIAALTDYLSKGGWFVMGTLVLAAMLLWYGLGYRMLTLRRGNRRNVRILIHKYSDGYPRKPRGIIDNAVVTGLKKRTREPSPASR